MSTFDGLLSRRTALKLAGVTGATALLAGCPDDEEPEPDDEEPDEEVDVDEWRDIDEFYFEGRIEAWTGIEPDIIADEDNPDLILIEGQEYDFRWVNGDGVLHNIEIRDDGDDVVDDYETDGEDTEGEEEVLEGVVASEEMVTYICQYHPTTQVGDIEVHSE